MDDLLAGLTPPLDGRGFRWSVGTRVRPESAWLNYPGDAAVALQEKRRVLTEHHRHVVCRATDSVAEAACLELLDQVLANLADHHGTDYVICGDVVTQPRWGLSCRIDRTDPIGTLATLLPHDLCLLLPTESGLRLVAAAVCFTSRWSLTSKMGLNLAEIHAPVPGYDARLGNAVDQLINRLSGETVLGRKNWTLLDTNEWFLPEPATAPSDSESQPGPTSQGDPAITAVSEDVIDELLTDGWLRIEDQTLRRLPTSQAVVFGIATTITPTKRLTPDQRHRMWGAAMSAPPAVATYKSWSNVSPTGWPRIEG